MQHLLLLFLVISFFLRLSAQPAIAPQPDTVLMRANLTFLASDELEGRETATRGERRAAEYIASRLSASGIKPYPGSPDYLQPFKLTASRLNASSTITPLQPLQGNLLPLTIGKDFLPPFEGLAKVTGEFNFAYVRFGISSAKDSVNDLKGIDLKGKYAVVSLYPLEGDEEEFNSYADADALLDLDKRMETLSEAGAEGVMFIADQRLEASWSYIAEYLAGEKLSLQSDSEKSSGIKSFTLTNSAFTQLLRLAGEQGEQALAMLKAKKTPAPFEFTYQLNFDVSVTDSAKTAFNVIGCLQGTDPVLKDEYVLVSAHYDHLGVKRGKVYNGADDDGSGVVTIMETARLLKEAGGAKRSIVFIFHTGEEKGLFGSRYLTSSNAPFLAKSAALINIDMVGREHEDTIYSVGSEKLSSKLKGMVEAANSATADFYLNYKYDDPNDPERIFYRSDHYNYAQKLIPIVFFYDAMQADYHKPGDDVEKINFKKLHRITRLVSRLAQDLGNMEGRLPLDMNFVPGGREF